MEDYFETQTQEKLRQICVMLDWHDDCPPPNAEMAKCRKVMLSCVADAVFACLSQTGTLPKGWQTQLYPEQEASDV